VDDGGGARFERRERRGIDRMPQLGYERRGVAIGSFEPKPERSLDGLDREGRSAHQAATSFEPRAAPRADGARGARAISPSSSIVSVERTYHRATGGSTARYAPGVMSSGMR
jgi:hypothetical protein